MNDNGIVITTNYSQKLDDVFGKIVIAPTIKAQKLWEDFRKHPDIYILAPGYIVDDDGNMQLMEISLLMKAEV